MDIRSGFNMLTAAVVEGNYDVFFKAHGQLSSLEILTAAVADTLANLETKRPGHHEIERLNQEFVDKVNSLSELHRCAHRNDAEKAVELVLNDGLDINTPALCNRTPLLWASLSSSGEFIETLIDLGANVNAQRTDDKEAPLTLSSGWNKFMAVYLLLDRGADANIASADGNSPLHTAVSKGFFDITKLLVEKGSYVNLQNKEGRTPLFLSVKNKHEQLIKLLIENEADVRIGYKENSTERFYLVRGKNRGRAAWHYIAGEQVNEPEIIDLLVKSGANVNAQDAEGFTPLHMAAIHGNLKIVKKLVDLDADVNIVATDGKNAAELAHLNEELEIKEYLESKMASLPRTKEKEEDSELADLLIEAYGLPVSYYLTESFRELNL